MAVIVYVRVSTEQQATEGVSLAAQVARIEGWAAGAGEIVSGIYEDTVSGKRADNRPGLQRALGVLNRDDILAVYSLSRLARSTQDTLAIAGRLDAIGAHLVSITEKLDTTTASGRLVFTFFGMLAQFEREIIAERTRSAMQHKRSTGQVYGHTPYGYSRDGNTLIPEPEEQAVLQALRALSRGGYSLHALARWLNENKISTKQGGAWYAATVRHLLLRDDPTVTGVAELTSADAVPEMPTVASRINAYVSTIQGRVASIPFQ